MGFAGGRIIAITLSALVAVDIVSYIDVRLTLVERSLKQLSDLRG